MAHTSHVTILFTDVVGSTELATSLTPDVADQLRRDHFTSLRVPVAAAGGTEVKNLGDGLMVVFPSASAAIGCAVSMQQVVEQAARTGPHALGLRVGISAGECTDEDGDYYGDPVIEAARLCAMADGGQIVVSDLARATAGRRSAFAFGSLGPLDLKGIPDTVDAFEVEWQPLDVDPGDASPAVPLPSRLRVAPAFGVVGRAAEGEVLADAWKRVASGNGRELVLVAGEPGMGKTTLAAACARAAFDAGAWVALGRCHEDLSAPYGPFAEPLRHLVSHVPEELLRAHVDQQGAELVRIAPELKTRLVDLPAPAASDPDTERYLLFGTVVAFLEQASAHTPVLLLLDDLHWGDAASLQLLRHLVAADTESRVLVLATYRDSELSSSHPLTDTLAALRREHGITRLDLKGLDDTGVIAFMETAAGHDLDETAVGLAHALSRETDGNPFFVGEVLRNLAETGAISQDDSGTWSAATALSDMVLPDSVREVVGSRVGRLGEESERVLAVAAVIGRDFDLALLARVSDEDEDALIDLLDGAIGAALLVEVADRPGRYSFSHALVQHTLYGDLGPTRRARAHRRVAEALEALCGDDPGDRVGELAHHWASATQPVDLDKAVSYAKQAGERALAALAPDEAVRHFSHALRMADQRPDANPALRVDLLLGLGVAQRHSGRQEFRETLLEAARLAREQADTERLVEAALANSRGIFAVVGLLDEPRIEVLEAALAALPGTDSPARARLLARLCSELAWAPLERRLALATEAKQMARRLGDTSTLLEVVNDCAVSLRVPDALWEQLAEQEALVNSVDRDTVNPTSLYWLCEQTYCEATRAGRFELADRCLETMEHVAHRLGQPILLWNLGSIRSSQAMRHGDLDVAERICEEAYAIGKKSGQPDADVFYLAQFCTIRMHQGRSEEITDVISDVISVSPGSTAPSFRGALAVCHLLGGREEEARRILRTALRDELEHLQYDVIWLNAICNYAQLAFWLDDSEAAARLLSILEPFDDQIQFEGCDLFDPVATYAGGLATVLGRYDEAEAWFERAVALAESGGMRHALASTILYWGRMLIRRAQPGDRDRAIELLRRAQSSASDAGFRFEERRASSELERLGGG